MEKKTPLYSFHLENKGKMVPFAGYLLPVQYETGLITEHNATRTNAGLFDVSHMGELIITGKDALANINHLLTNDFTKMNIGQVRYSPMCNHHGGVVDDLLVYKLSEEKYMMVVNAANCDKDVQWVRDSLFGDAVLADVSDNYAQLALQGPASRSIIRKLAQDSDIPKKYYTFVPHVEIAGIWCDISRTGYTGEYGYEILCAPDDALALWNAIIEAGQEFGIVPCGLGARDTLRLEAGMPLYGHEMDENTTPLEACLDFAVKLDKPDFIGQKALLENPPKRIRIGLRVVGRGIVREGSDVFLGETAIGKTTSGTHAPFLGYAIAVALVEKDKVSVGERVTVDVRGRLLEAEVISPVFYKRA